MSNTLMEFTDSLFATPGLDRIEQGKADAQEKEAFTVDNDQKAEWALMRIAKIDREYARYSDVCQKQIDFYTQELSKAKQERDNDRSYFVSQLAQYFETVEPKATKTQATYKLPYGKLVKKLEKQEFKHDAEKLIESLKDTEFVEYKPNLKWGEYKKTLQIVGENAVDENGEIVDGVTVETKPASFDVEVSL